jgi:hypothetical protein
MTKNVKKSMVPWHGVSSHRGLKIEDLPKAITRLVKMSSPSFHRSYIQILNASMFISGSACAGPND